MSQDETDLYRRARPPDRVLAYGAAPGQILEVRPGTGGEAVSRPLVIIIHGGFWRADIDRVHARPMADAIATAGWTTLLPEYARVPGDPAVTLRDLTLMLAAAPGCMSAHDGRIVLVGHSAGGHLALWASAARVCPTLSATLALAPAADLLLAHELGLGNGAVSRFLGCDPVSRPDIDPRQMPGPDTPTTLVHGVEDAIVPLIVGESYAAAHPQVRWVPVAGAGHFALIDPLASAWRIVMAELATLG